MAAVFHTPMATHAAGNVASVNAPLLQLDTALQAISGGATVTAARLKEWTEGEQYMFPPPTTPHATYPNLPASGSAVVWPDGSAGVLTIDAVDVTWEAISAYHITHVASGKTVTQTAITRDANGFPTSQPVLTVA